ncbi:hypothetical protein [Bosea sp. (in: a-proteobacteria)]|uniref:hypothetical protein n=1 Tax=Bosea sp. (in: a-proteobacteria) TaxID=1871050 RepID=UPI002FCC479E
MSKLNALAARLTRSRRKMALASEAAAMPSLPATAGARPVLIVLAGGRGAEFSAGPADGGRSDGARGTAAQPVGWLQRQ